MTGTAKGTVLKLLAQIGKACAEYQDKVFRDLTCERIQCDEIRAFCYAKEKNVPKDKKGTFGFGDTWTFTALCADSKLVPSWRIGRRDLHNATLFMKDLASRLKNKVQLTVSFRQACIAERNLPGVRLGGKRSPVLPVVAP